MVDRKDRFALITYFLNACQKATGSKPIVNKYAAQWDADALIDSYGLQVCKDLVDRYISISATPSWKRFANSSDRAYTRMQEEAADKEARRIMLERMKIWMQ